MSMGTSFLMANKKKKQEEKNPLIYLNIFIAWDDYHMPMLHKLLPFSQLQNIDTVTDFQLKNQ